MGVSDDDIRELVSSIWETLFMRPVDPGRDRTGSGTAGISSYVAIEGRWQGGVQVEMPTGLAARLTAEILRTDDEPSAEQQADAIGELCNIVAGGFKALVPAPSQLTLPIVALGSDYRVRVIGSQRTASVPFADHGDEFVVTVHEGPVQDGPERA